VDIVRLSPETIGTLATLEAFRTNERGLHPLTLTDKADCNGYWQRVAGLELRQ